MSDFFLEILRRYGLYGIAVAVVIAGAVWFTAHSAAKPGERIELFFGMIAYSKEGAFDEELCDLPWRERSLDCPVEN